MAVEKVGQDESLRRFVTCGKCGAKLAYYPKDVCEKMTLWGDGSESISCHVWCPECRRAASVKRS